MLSEKIVWRARLHPTRVAATLDPAEGKRLCTAAQAALAASVNAGHIPRIASPRPAGHDPRSRRVRGWRASSPDHGYALTADRGSQPDRQAIAHGDEAARTADRHGAIPWFDRLRSGQPR
jgi:hypothetical protein